jgi:hypothetical protein
MIIVRNRVARVAGNTARLGGIPTLGVRDYNENQTGVNSTFMEVI